MSRPPRLAVPLALLALFLVSGCAAFNELVALRQVAFTFAGVSDVRLAGIPIGPGARYTSLGVADAARLGAAMVAKQAILELTVHASAANPPENKTAARLVALDWEFFVEERRLLEGKLGSPVTLRPGQPVDIPLMVRFDLLELGGGGARDLFDLAIAIAGQGSVQKELRLELMPTIESSLGPIRYPSPIVITRGAATH